MKVQPLRLRAPHFLTFITLFTLNAMFHIRPAKCTSPVRRFFAGATLPLLLASLALPQAAGAAREGGGRPNIIFILTDDQGWGDAHFAGHPQVRTPNLDRLAAGGTWFRQFYVAATVCSPSRAAFMTSHCPARHQVHGHFADSKSNAARSMPDWLDPDVTTLPDLLKKAGYATAHFGKWHLGAGEGAPPPEAYGIDVSKTVNSSGPSLGNEGAEPYFRAKSTRLIVDETIEFIRRNQGSPFYVNLWTLLPHAALKPTPEQLAEYAALQPSADDPAYGAWMQKYLAGAKDLRSQMQVFLASLTDLDTQVGRLLDALDEMKISENTLIVYSSDNGPEDYRIGNAANAGVAARACCGAASAACMKEASAPSAWCAGPAMCRRGGWMKRAWWGRWTCCRRWPPWPESACRKAWRRTARI